MEKTEPFKRGRTFKMLGVFVDSQGAALVINDPDIITAQIRDINDVIFANLDVEPTATSGTYLFSYDGDTSNWPLGALYVDARAVIGGDIEPSDSVQIPIERQITRVVPVNPVPPVGEL